MFLGFLNRHYFILLFAFLAGFGALAYHLGYLEGKGAVASNIVLSCSPDTLTALDVPSEVLAKEKPSIPIGSNLAASATAQGKYVGSKNGTKYYTPGCPGTKRIKVENYIWFKDAEDANLQGYTKGSC